MNRKYSICIHAFVRRDRLDDVRLLPRFRERAAMIEAQRRVLQTAVRESFAEGPGPSIPQATRGDPRDLRGIPVIGVRGASGASPGTSPEREVVRRDDQRRR